METAPVPSFGELISGARRSAVHLEMRDVYDPGSRRFATWRAGHRENPADREEWWSPFHQVVADSVTRGVQVRRARVVSEPLSEYVRFEYDVTFSNIAAGEQVRWLARRRASDLALPVNDFWVFDDRLVRLSHFAGDGTFVEDELTDDPAIVKLCLEAFEQVWERALDHHDFHPA
ncbi:DUF6879 family protein [Sphaerisporangium sp. NPDC051011]|uniref:DUF6879 family protein n=1 Tax=Sphaerisporangium sp. NPDC051011 TaxID=3155792 RepID=UPI0033D8DBA0